MSSDAGWLSWEKREPTHAMMIIIFIQDPKSYSYCIIEKKPTKQKSLQCPMHTGSHSLPVEHVFFPGKQSLQEEKLAKFHCTRWRILPRALDTYYSLKASLDMWQMLLHNRRGEA